MKNACLILVGVLLGWWLHDLTPGSSPIEAPVSAVATQVKVTKPSYENTVGISESDNSRTATTYTPDIATKAYVRRFGELLAHRQFEQAIAYYEQALLLDDSHQSVFKPALVAYLKACMQQCADGTFVDLVDLWLATYYQDIPVLLLLAEHQRLQGSPEEAATTLQIAATYALQVDQRESVVAAVQHLVGATDEYLSQQQAWIELLGFYEYLDTIDLGSHKYMLRQASLYQILGEPVRSRELLLELQADDDKLNTQWTTTLARLLAQDMPAATTIDLPVNAIAVIRRGDHFLVNTSLNGIDQVILMIDTGASITTLSRASFAALASRDYVSRGSRVFNTANGRTRGHVYRAASLTLGETRISDVDVAVIDYQPSTGVDGLLGMNVLRNFRFEIDQDKALLHLRPR